MERWPATEMNVKNGKCMREHRVDVLNKRWFIRWGEITRLILPCLLLCEKVPKGGVGASIALKTETDRQVPNSIVKRNDVADPRGKIRRAHDNPSRFGIFFMGVRESHFSTDDSIAHVIEPTVIVCVVLNRSGVRCRFRPTKSGNKKETTIVLHLGLAKGMNWRVRYRVIEVYCTRC